MPEAPEVRIIADLLRDYLLKVPIAEWDISDDKYQSLQYEAPVGTTITKIQTHGKTMYFELSNGKYIYHHLMLHGWWTDEYEEKYKVSITTSRGTVYLVSSDRLTQFKVITKAELNKKLSELGPDLMETAVGEEMVSEESFIDIVKSHYRAKIGTFLMNQKYFAGIGNYLRSDILNVAAINPHRKISTLENDEIKNLYSAIMSVLKEAYDKHGSVNYNQERGLGKTGYDFKVYNKEQDPEGNDVLKEKLSNRYIYWAPDTQI